MQLNFIEKPEIDITRLLLQEQSVAISIIFDPG